MNNQEELRGSKCRHALMLVLLLAFGCSTGSSTTQPESLIRADSAIVVSGFGGAGRIESTTIMCKEGKTRAVVTSRARRVLSEGVKLGTEAYVQLWSELQKDDVWELPSGELWSWLEWLEAGQGLPVAVQASPEEYQDPEYDCGFVAVKIRVGNKAHGFIRYCPHRLKDARYHRIIVAISGLKGIREASIKLGDPW